MQRFLSSDSLTMHGVGDSTETRISIQMNDSAESRISHGNFKAFQKPLTPSCFNAPIIIFICLCWWAKALRGSDGLLRRPSNLLRSWPFVNIRFLEFSFVSPNGQILQGSTTKSAGSTEEQHRPRFQDPRLLLGGSDEQRPENPSRFFGPDGPMASQLSPKSELLENRRKILTKKLQKFISSSGLQNQPETEKLQVINHFKIGANSKLLETVDKSTYIFACSLATAFDSDINQTAVSSGHLSM